jgi:hypothetical protein
MDDAKIACQICQYGSNCECRVVYSNAVYDVYNVYLTYKLFVQIGIDIAAPS